MDEALDAIEDRISRLRVEMRAARAAADLDRLEELRTQLTNAQNAWDDLLGMPADRPLTASLKSAREQVVQTLNLIGAPAARKVIRTVHEAFFGTELPDSRTATLRRDEERSYLSRASSRTYVCPALTADGFQPARSVLVSSAWPLAQRLLGPDSERVNYLIMASNLADAGKAHDVRPGTAVDRLLQEVALNLQGVERGRRISPERIYAAAQAELERIAPRDQATRARAAQDASRLAARQQLFGVQSGSRSAPRHDPRQPSGTRHEGKSNDG
ncbi:hypothetical protein [Streptomyces marianii]|uniref:Uncharacterized protein n=1 Tax=Streptomyces marianii TaxID=1817406 RepID=A0A5R9DWF7_9ACTN|nr:hypothetical protein [Streptomyces marianii]TLQ39413.1 hypothetical protein FEF34_39230 [Streptomyces marianii]